jgi:hypothetical protein
VTLVSTNIATRVFRLHFFARVFTEEFDVITHAELSDKHARQVLVALFIHKPSYRQDRVRFGDASGDTFVVLR